MTILEFVLSVLVRMFGIFLVILTVVLFPLITTSIFLDALSELFSTPHYCIRQLMDKLGLMMTFKEFGHPYLNQIADGINSAAKKWRRKWQNLLRFS